jgi:hypothetical protein
MPSRPPTRAIDPRGFPDSARSSKTIATARSRSSAGCCSAPDLLPLPRHFGQLAELVTEDMVTAPCGPDPAPYVKGIRAYEEAGFDEVYLGQVGGRLEGAFEFFATQVLPRVRES